MLSYPFDYEHTAAADTLAPLLGGKGAGLAMMSGELGLPVPPGFTLSTDACRIHRTHGWNTRLEAALDESLRDLERRVGERLGDPNAPLFLSVRSGAPVSMPGMMDTVLNVGLNEKTYETLAAADPSFAADCRAHFIDSYRASVGRTPPDDVGEQLRAAIEAVFRSANSPRAHAYREREGLVDDDASALTAVNIQRMVFGNRDERSATGVVFSRDPATGEPGLYGDVLFRAQGEDVVAGRRRTRAIDRLAERMPVPDAALRRIARRLERRLRDLCEIEFTIERDVLWILQVRKGQRSPRAALRIAHDLALDPAFPLERHEATERVLHILRDPPCEIEPIESSPEGSVVRLAQGLAASPGIARGEIAVDVDRAVRRAAEGAQVILCRPETSPSDVAGMRAASGLLTARGGFASHAAVVARAWGLPAVVGVETLVIEDDAIRLGAKRLANGDALSIDGSQGLVWSGHVETHEQAPPELAVLSGWARELGLESQRVAARELGLESQRVAARELGLESQRVAATPSTATGTDPAEPPSFASGIVSPATAATVRGDTPTQRQASETAIDGDEIVRCLSIRGSTLPTAIAAALGCDSVAVETNLERLIAEGLAAPAKPLGFGLTEAGRAKADTLRARDRAALGLEAAQQALVEFQDLDTRIKRAVTDWQVRSIGGEAIPNDHGDPAWDESVLDRLSEVVALAEPWLARLHARLPRLARYVERLDTALTAVRGGDRRFVASPIVDSLHGVWFELHEELIRLADSSRARENAEGRAG